MTEFIFPVQTKRLSPEIHSPRIDAISGIVYRQIKQLRRVDTLLMSVLIPRTARRKPAIVYFPGGGFISADHEKFIELRMQLARAGFVVAACQYRTIPAQYPALIDDAKQAVRYLRAHADEFMIDPDRIGVVGDSAGGYVAQMLGTTGHEPGWDRGEYAEFSSSVQAAVSLYGISDLGSIGEGLNQDRIHASAAVTEALLLNGPAFKASAGASVLDDLPRALRASSLGHAAAGHIPPFLILHGSADRVVSPMQSIRLFGRLRELGADADLVCVPGAGHGDLVWFQPEVTEAVCQWLAEKLGADPGDPRSWS